MKRVSIITIIDNNNFGTFLQAYALCRKVEDLGYKPELVDYCRKHLLAKNRWWKSMQQTWNPLRWIVRTKSIIDSHLLHQKDRKFIKKNLSKRICHTVDEIRNSIQPADVYMTGSDQVWNSIHNQGLDRAFYLDYAPTGAKKVSYAASVGMPEFQDWERKETKLLLEQYKHITLREDSAIKLLGSLGLDESKLTSVLDPTLLLTKEDWFKAIKLPRLHTEKYLLVYSVEEKPQDAVINKVAKQIAKERNLKVVGVYYGNSYNRIECCDYNHFRATPDVFLSLMYYADFVVVSSFHGTAFSINFGKDFYTIMPNRFNSRVNNILHLLGLEDRLISNNDSMFHSCSIDYTDVHPKLNNERQKSISILKHIIDE